MNPCINHIVASRPPSSRSDLEQNGYALVRSVIDQQQAARIATGIACALGSVGAGAGGRSGHALRHLMDLVPAVKELAQGKENLSLIEDVLGSKAFVARSLFFDKTPGANWKVAWHQNLTIAVQQRIETPGFGPWSLKEGVIHVQPP